MEFDSTDLLNRISGDRQLAVRVLHRFLEDMPVQLAALAHAVEGGDAGNAAVTAHAIRGAAANVGGFAIHKVAARLEHICRGGDLEAARALTPELAMAFEQATGSIAEFCGAARGGRL